MPVPDEVEAHVRRRLATMVTVEPEVPCIFKKGEVVRIVRSPFEGFDAVFDRRLSPEGRAQVFLELMGRLVAAELDLGDLWPPR